MRRALLGLVLVAGCSSGAPANSPATPPPASVTITGDAAKMWTPMRPVLRAGDVTIVIRSTGKTHDFRLRGAVTAASGPIFPGQSRTLRLTLPAGRYSFRCSYHHAMTGTLTVRP